jgi:hypothetical protein
MSEQQSAELMMEILHLVEQAQAERVAGYYHPDIEFHWPPGLPYSGDFKGGDVAIMNERFVRTWMPLRPTEEIRRMDARVVATGQDGRVIVHYMWRCMDGAGHRFETETLADYQLRDGRLWRAQMFYYDLRGLIAFLDTAEVSGARPDL